MERTLMLIKPDAVSRHLIGNILSIVEREGFRIVDLRMEKFSKNKAKLFYSVHKDKDFFMHLVNYMTSGKSVGVILERENAVYYLREVVGETDPAKAKEKTIRHLYGETYRRNSVHASDSRESYMYESRIFFKETK
ncbi:MAG: nucleoside-diphosphate kinase [bacterium]